MYLLRSFECGLVILFIAFIITQIFIPITKSVINKPKKTKGDKNGTAGKTKE